MTANEPLGPLDPTDDFERDVRALMEGGFSAEKAMEMASNRGIKRPATPSVVQPPAPYVPAPPANTFIVRGASNVVPLVSKAGEDHQVKTTTKSFTRPKPDESFPNRGTPWSKEDYEKLHEVLASLPEATSRVALKNNVNRACKALGRDPGGVIYKVRDMARQGKIDPMVATRVWWTYGHRTTRL